MIKQSIRHITLYTIIILGVMGLLLSCGGGEADKKAFETIYNNYRKAVEKGDLETLKDFLTANRRAELSGEEAKSKLEMVQAMLPQNIKTVSVEVSDKTATLKVTGELSGRQMAGDIHFTLEGKQWKINKEEWQINLDSSSADNPVFTGETVSFWDGTDPPPGVEMILEGHQDDVSHLAYTPDGKYLISASYSDYSLRMWDARDGVELDTARTPKRVRSIAISADSAFIFTGDAYKNILRWPIQDNKIGPPETLAGDSGDYMSISSDGKYIAATAFQAPVLKLSLKSDQKTIPITRRTDHRVLLFSPSSQFLVGGGEGNYYTVWDTKNWREKRYSISKIGGDSTIAAIDVSRNEKYLATGHTDSSIVIYDFQERRELHNYFVKDASTSAVKFSPDNNILATAQYDNNIYLWNAATGKQLAVLSEHKEAATCLAFSPDGSALASGGEDRVIVIWRSGLKPDQDNPYEPGEADTGSDDSDNSRDSDYEPEWIEFDGHDNFIGDNNTNRTTPVWITKGDVSYELRESDNYMFVIRYGGMFQQDVELEESTGKYALIISWGAGERYNDNQDQTGLPYLYGYFLSRSDPEKIIEYLKGEQLLLSINSANEWGVMWGVFEIPPDTGSIRFFMHQADGTEPQNGSAAYFDEPGIFIFDNKDDAIAFAKEY
jgi:WD40 repeat protein